MTDTVLSLYADQVARKEVQRDAAQQAVAEKLDLLAAALLEISPRRSRFLDLIARPKALPRGLYIHGGVGRGKTMLMDLFFDTIRSVEKRRAHFHEFMADVHDRIAGARDRTPGDPIPVVAKDIAAEARLLCFDEVQINDIADAMILGRLFKGLFEAGTVVVATSNAHPSDLYRNGLNRSLFLPFISLIGEHMEIVELKAAKDFRLEKLAGQRLYFCPADRAARVEIDSHWKRLTGLLHHGARQTIDVKGRKVLVPAAAMGVARFNFTDLCDQPLGALDYLHIAHAFHTVIIDRIPQLTRGRRDVARRFITLIDALYDNKVCLIASAEAEPDQLYPEGDGADHFQRTVSRLMEMRSEGYLAKRHNGGP